MQSIKEKEQKALRLAYLLRRTNMDDCFQRAWNLEDGYTTAHRIMSGQCSLKETLDFSMINWEKQIAMDIVLFKYQIKRYLKQQTNYSYLI